MNTSPNDALLGSFDKVISVKNQSIDFFGHVDKFLRMSELERVSVLELIQSTKLKALALFEPEIRATTLSDLLKAIDSLEENTLFEADSVGWVEAWRDFDDTNFMLNPHVLFSSFHDSMGGGPFHGIRYYPNLLAGFSGEFKRLFLRDCFFSKEDEDQLYPPELAFRITCAGVMISRLEQGSSSFRELLRESRALLDSFSCSNCTFFDTIASWMISTEGWTISDYDKRRNPFWCSPLSWESSKQFHSKFGSALSAFDWRNKRQVAWLKRHLCGSWSGI